MESYEESLQRFIVNQVGYKKERSVHNKPKITFIFLFISHHEISVGCCVLVRFDVV